MVEPQPSKLMVWVRFPSPAPDLSVQGLVASGLIKVSFYEPICSYSSVGRALPW